MTELHRSIKTPGAILMGLGSILGTGLFVSLAIATQIAGNGIIIAIVIAGILAALNGLSSAQLAANFPVSGGTYEYGYRVLGSYWGFSAGWMFLLAKTASAATAALGCAGYIFYLFGISSLPWLYVGSGLVILLVITTLVSGGIHRSNVANMAIVSLTFFGLLALVAGGSFREGIPVQALADSFSGFSGKSVLYASALMFVAFTGYGRIATLGEEVVEPARTIPRAIILSLVIIIVIYIAVALTAIQVLGPQAFGKTVDGEAAPLMVVARALEIPGLGTLIAIAAITAMLGVLLNLILGISRVMFGMARRSDLPAFLGSVHPKTKSPAATVWATGGLIGILILTGDVALTWSFSAFTVLIYYAITNLAALLLPADKKRYPAWVPAGGLAGCLFLAFWIDPAIWISGLILLLTGICWHYIALRRSE